MSYTRTPFKSYVRGLTAVTATSFTATGDITAGGNVLGAIVRASTALEFPTSGVGPGVRASDDTDSGFGVVSANQASMWAGGFIWWSALVGSVQSSNAAQITASGSFVQTPRAVDIAAVGTTVAVAGSRNVFFTLNSGNVTSTAAPFIADGADGQEIWLLNVDTADTLTLSDQGTLAGSNLRLGAATRAIGPRDLLGLRFSSTIGDWVEIVFTNVT